MKPLMPFVMFAFIACFSFQTSSAQTVVDYYLRISEQTFLCDMTGIVKDSKDYRISKIVKMDTRNGYLLALNDYLWIQVAEFTYSGKTVVGVAIVCGMGCMCNEKTFYEVESNGDFKDVTAEVLPKEYQDAGWIILPEKGTTLQIYDYDLLDRYDFKPMTEAQKKALRYELLWEKGKFVLKK